MFLSKLLLTIMCHLPHIVFLIKKCDLIEFGRLKLIESGLLDFGYQWCKLLNQFYAAISYIPPHGEKEPHLDLLSDCVADRSPFVQLVTEVNAEYKKLFPTRNSFIDCYGTMATDHMCYKSSFCHLYSAK